MDIGLVFQIIKYIKHGLPVIMEILKAIKEAQDMFGSHNCDEKKKDGKEKKLIVKEMLRAKGIDETNTEHLDDAINFGKALLKNNNAFSKWV